MAGRRTNLALASLLALATVSGFLAMAAGTALLIPAAFIHGVIGLGLVVLSPWKTAISRRGWSRTGEGRSFSAALTLFTVVALVSGLGHAAGVATLGVLSMMQVHVGSGLAALIAGAIHYRMHAVRFRTTDVNRRNLLLAAGTTGLAALAWVGWQQAIGLAGWRGYDRRFTGSHEVASGEPDRMPATVWINDRIPERHAADWTITAAGEPLSIADLATYPQSTVRATLDCTGGWYSTQVWSGVRLSDMLPDGEWRSVVVTSATGYARRLPRRDAMSAILAVSVGEELLTPRHGAPARLVVPDRRGFWWVKWVTAVEPSPLPWWMQLPFPAT